MRKWCPPIKHNSKIRRNDACPCRSGLKYKKCCGKPGMEIEKGIHDAILRRVGM